MKFPSTSNEDKVLRLHLSLLLFPGKTYPYNFSKAKSQRHPKSLENTVDLARPPQLKLDV